MSYRTVIDKVLTRLREDTIGADWSGVLSDSSTVDDYQKLVGELVNETKDLVHYKQSLLQLLPLHMTCPV